MYFYGTKFHKCPSLTGLYAKTKEGETQVWQFRDLEEGNGEEMILVFATATNLYHLSKADGWYGDGTFKVCPKLFYQLYAIHAEVHGQILPLVFILLPSKSKKCYRFMWTKLNELMAQKGMHPNLKGLEVIWTLPQ